MWPLSFISEEDLTEHVQNTIQKYDKKLHSRSLKDFNSNQIDPIKLIFDKIVYDSSWEEILSKELFRQRDKSNNNDIGYFHQQLFKYIEKCRVPDSGWDVVFEDANGIQIMEYSGLHSGVETFSVSRVYVEMKNKHNTMNSSSSADTFKKMQNQILKDDDCVCFLVEVIAKQSQNVKWAPKVDGEKTYNNRIRRVSLDRFYALVTGQEDAFYQLCMVLPIIIEKVVKQSGGKMVPQDSVYDELASKAISSSGDSSDYSISLATYDLAFHTYLGFK